MGSLSMERVLVNPVIPGFAPDPSLVYVDGTYFLVNSSFHLFPGLPIYASKDLREWKHIGNALNRVGQMNIQHSLTKICGPKEAESQVAAQGGIFAPTLRHHKGTFYVVCTNVFHRRYFPQEEAEHYNFVLSTTDIWADEWSDPVYFDFFGIDTSLFWDDDGRVYVVGSGAPAPESKIRQFEIDLKTGKALSETKQLWEGITKVFPEGPHMYKKDGWYYLLIAEGGCFEDHHVNMARSRNIWGPYEVNPANPVLAKADLKGYIQYTGHGDLFQDPTGQWYFVCLGVRKINGHFIMGRESVLTTATWPEGEYPVIDAAQVDVPLAPSSNSSPEWPLRRKPGRPDPGFLCIRMPVEENYEYNGNNVTLTSSKTDVSQAKEPVTFTGKRQRHLDGSSSATLEALDMAATEGAGLKTGLCYYKDEFRYIRLFLDVDSREMVLETVNKARYVERRTSRSVAALNKGTKVTFGVDHTELEFVFWVSFVVDGTETREEFERIDTWDMTGHDFVGPIIGVFAVSDKEVKVRYSNILVEDI